MMKKWVLVFAVVALTSILAVGALFGETDNIIINISDGKAGYSTAIVTDPSKIPILAIRPKGGSALEHISFEIRLRNAYWDIEAFAQSGIADYGYVDKDGVFTPEYGKSGYLTGRRSPEGVKYTLAMGEKDNIAIVTLDEYAYVSQYDAIYIPILAEITGNQPYAELYSDEYSDLTVDGYYYFTGNSRITTQVRAGAPKDFSQTVNIADLSIHELTQNAFVAGTLTLRAPAGYRWINIEQIQMTGRNTTGSSIAAKSFATGGQNQAADTSALRLDLTMNTVTSGNTRVFVFSNLQLEALPGNENFGPVSVTLSGCNMEQETVVVANRVRMDYTFKAESQNLETIITGDRPSDTVTHGFRTLKVTMEEAAPGRWRSESLTTFLLPEGVTAVAVMINTANLATDLPQDTLIRRIDENAYALNTGSSGIWTLAANGLSIQNVKAASGRIAKLELTFYVTVADSCRGPIYLTAGGSGLQPETAIAIAQVVQRSASGSVVLTIGSKEMKLGGETILMDVAPFIEDGYTMVPVSFIARALGLPADGVRWDGVARTVTINTGVKEAVLTIDSKEMKISGVVIEIPKAPVIRDGRTFLPFRVLGEQVLGVAVGWDESAGAATFY